MAVETANDGQAACDAILAGLQPTLVLMDCQMPIMDGYAATRRIRQWESQAGATRMPIVAFTASTFKEDLQRCTDAGMDDFIAKPIDVSQLASVIERWARTQDSET